MRKHFLIYIFLITSFSISFGQNKLSINFGYGNYLSNSENSMKITGEKDFNSYFLFGFNYERQNVFGYNFLFEYSYNQIHHKDVITFVYTEESTPEPLGSFGADLSLINHNIDLNYIGNVSIYFRFGFGPSFVITNRIMEVVVPDGVGGSTGARLYDKLASSGIGANGFLEFRMPVMNNFFFTSKLKLRYTHSIWFDEGIRKLDDYYQEFFTGEISAGIGYSF